MKDLQKEELRAELQSKIDGLKKTVSWLLLHGTVQLKHIDAVIHTLKFFPNDEDFQFFLSKN